MRDACFLVRAGCRDGRALLKSTTDRNLARSMLRELADGAALEIRAFVIALDHLRLAIPCNSPAELAGFMAG